MLEDVDVLDDVDVDVDVVAGIEVDVVAGVVATVSAGSGEDATPERVLDGAPLEADDESTVAAHAGPATSTPSATITSVAGRAHRSRTSRRSATCAV